MGRRERGPRRSRGVTSRVERLSDAAEERDPICAGARGQYQSRSDAAHRVGDERALSGE